MPCYIMTAKSIKRRDWKKAKEKIAGEISYLAWTAMLLAGCWSARVEREPVPIHWENRYTEAGRDVLTGIWGERKQFHSTTQSVNDSFINWPPFGKRFLIKCRILGETSNMQNHPKWPRLLELWPSELRCKDWELHFAPLYYDQLYLACEKGSISNRFFSSLTVK